VAALFVGGMHEVAAVMARFKKAGGIMGRRGQHRRAFAPHKSIFRAIIASP
jgi:hypothetical protein